MALALILASASAQAAPLSGDFDGDGDVDAGDETLLKPLYGAAQGAPGYDAAADLVADSVIDVSDLAVFGAAFGATGGDPDTSPPSLLVTLNDIPDNMNDLLVVPPEGFQITPLYDGGTTLMNPGSLSVTASHDMGGVPAGGELAGLFTAGQQRSVWELPAGADLPRTTHTLTVSVRDIAGNQASAVYSYAVRDFAYGPPLGNLQTLYLDFDQNRSLGTDVDFLEDLRSLGLSSTADAALEAQMRDTLAQEIVGRAHAFFGREPDGTPGTDAANVLFTDSVPSGTHSRLCIGGASSLGASYLGASTMDVNNLDESSDECGVDGRFGVFPQALKVLWGSNAAFKAAFDPLRASAGGTPVGENPLDAIVLDPLFDPYAASTAEMQRWLEIANAADAFAQAIATVAAHETGHLLGLVAHGAAPAGLWGGSSGATIDHNVKVGGGHPVENYVMNAGSTFSFDEMTGRSGQPLPVFRPIAWAYLRDRVALNTQVTGLYPPPLLFAVTPNPASYPQGQQTTTLTFLGDDFVAPLLIELIVDGDPTPNDVLNEVVLDPQTATGAINKFSVPAGQTYDVHLINGDGQDVTLIDGLTVQ